MNVECGIVSKHMQFIPEGERIVLPETTVPYAKIARFVWGLSKSKKAKAAYEQYVQEEQLRKNAWKEILSRNPRAIQYCDGEGYTSVKIITKDRDGYRETLFDRLGPICHTTIDEKYMYSLHPNGGQVHVIY